MAFPTLKQLSDPKRSPRELAALLLKHIGDGSNDSHCEQAYKALRRIRDPRIQQVVTVTAGCFSVPPYTYSQMMNEVIRVLQNTSWEYVFKPFSKKGAEIGAS